jgi:glycosyltransferase 2 family protein
MQTAPRKTLRRRTGVSRLLLGAGVAAIAVAVTMALRGQDWSAVGSAMRGHPPGFFALIVAGAFLANSAALVLSMATWRAMVIGVGEPVSVAAAARIYFVGVFAKFVPGKVLGFVTSIQMGRAIGISAGRIISAWLLALAILLQTGLTVGLLAGPDVLGGSAVWVVLAALPIGLVMARPNLVNWAATLAARLLRRPPPPRVSGRQIRQAIATQFVSWVFAGLHLWLLAIAVGAPPGPSLLLCVGAFGLASVLGLLAVFTPEGLGVREVVLMIALGAILPLPAASAVVLVSRLVFTVSEVTTAGVGLLVTGVLRRRQRGRRARKQPWRPEPAVPPTEREANRVQTGQSRRV